jgi:hypothetical protein
MSDLGNDSHEYDPNVFEIEVQTQVGLVGQVELVRAIREEARFLSLWRSRRRTGHRQS